MNDSLPVAALRRIGAVTVFLAQIVARIGPALARPGLIVRQIYNAGARSLVIIMLSGMFVGMVLGLLGFDVFQRFGSEDYVGVLAALGNLKVLGPVLTALLFTKPTVAELPLITPNGTVFVVSRSLKLFMGSLSTVVPFTVTCTVRILSAVPTIPNLILASGAPAPV